MKKLLLLSLLPLLMFSCGKKERVPFRLHDLFTDHMVLQREVPVKIYGYGTAGDKVTVTLGEEKVETTINNDNKWTAGLPAMNAGGPHEINIVHKDTTILLKDVLIGDVWICSGQSNMEWPLSRSNSGEEEIAAAAYPNMRFFELQHDIEFFPLDSLRFKTSWYRGDEEKIAEFSAVGYFFGKNLHERMDVPVGLIGTHWGGTVVEAWASFEGLEDVEEFREDIQFMKETDKMVRDFEAKGSEVFKEWKDGLYYKGPGLEKEWYDPATDISGWKQMEIPNFWEEVDPEMEHYDGSVWFRRSFDLPESFTGKTIKLYLSKTDDHDMVWLNGEKLGEQFGYNTWTNFEVPPELLKEKDNVIVVRIFDTGGAGGLGGTEEFFDYHPVGNRSRVESLAGTWYYKPGVSFTAEGDVPRVQGIGPNDYPALLYNAMVHPLIGFPVSGAIWYQGESNAGRAYQYRYLFPGMIKDWRNHWNMQDMPFFWVQLANFMERHDEPTESAWAELREAQTMTLSLPMTGMAVTIDIGEAGDIHPRNKKDVGKRLALNAFHVAYGIDTVHSGPMYKSHKVEGDRVTVEFNHTGSGLVTSDGKSPRGFALAGPDSVFHRAAGLIEESKVVLVSPRVQEPIAVRYGWADNPDVNLYNEEGLPAVPFRTDDFPGVCRQP